MGDIAVTLDQVLREAGLVAKWEARAEARGLVRGEARGLAKGLAKGEAKGLAKGEEKKAREIAKNLLGNGFSLEQTAHLSGLDLAEVRKLTDNG